MHFVVTGANRGIGLEFVRQLAARGASVHCTARDPAGATELQALAAASEGRVRVHALDVTDDASVARFASALPQAIDVLINNAGGPMASRLDRMTDERWRAGFEVDFFAAARLSVAAVGPMRSAGWGRIVNVASTYGREPDPVFAAYGAAKAAVDQWVRDVGAEQERRGGVHVVAVAPGTIQLPPDGQPIVLLADAQTVGGYPRLGHVIAVDLPLLAQIRPGEALRFAPCDPATAARLACESRERAARLELMLASRT
ncbi:MAG: SDR family NAD(P)-dependent oxidoreductase [Proteobacteria bacterium]|nr:SDR family NAD(P)-dependent oxidoreductase [Pseudomonadota bacterium]